MKRLSNKAWVILPIILAAFYGVMAMIYIFSPVPGTGLESPMIPIVPIAAGGGYHYVILEDGNLWSWDKFWNVNGEYLTMVKEDVASIFTGPSGRLMIITADGTLYASGPRIEPLRNPVMQAFHFFSSSYRQRQLSRPLAPIMYNVTMFDMSNMEWPHAVAITSDRGLWGWGDGRSGQLSYVGSTRRPTRIMDDVVFVSVGGNSTLAVTTESALMAWGNNTWGQLGDGTRETRRTPIQVLENVVDVSTSGSRTFAVTSDGFLWGWGSNWNGNLGIGPEERRPCGSSEIRLEHVIIMEETIAVSAAINFTFAITTDGGLWAWGENSRGQLGDGTTENRDRPVRVLENVVKVVHAGTLSMAVKSDGTLWVWGGDTNNLSPVRVMDNVRIQTEMQRR